MNEETLTDRLAGGDYLLDGLVVHVIPRSGVSWIDPTLDARYPFERAPDDKRLTAQDVRAAYAAPGPLSPPSDVNAAGFTCCAACSTAPLTERCSGCPRGTAGSRLVERIKKCQG